MANHRKIKVALMSYAMDNRPGKGSAVYTRELISHLLDDDRFIFTLVHYEPVADPLYRRAPEIILPKFWLSSRWLQQLKWFWQARHEPFDLIHWFQPRLYPGYWWAPARFKIATIHGGGQFYYPWHSLSARMFDWVLKYLNWALDLAIVATTAARQEAAGTYRLSPNRLAVTYYGGGENFQPLAKNEALTIIQKRYPQIKGEFILTVSRLQPHKNLDNLIRGYNQFRDQSPTKPQLVIIAQPAESAAATYQLAQNSKYAKDIIFIDFVPAADLNYFYSAAVLFIFPSLSEGFGLPVVEAMAAGTPVAVSNIPVLAEVAGEAGTLFNPYKPDEIAAVLTRLLADTVYRDLCRRRGLNRAQEFTWAKTAAATKEIYLNLINHG